MWVVQVYIMGMLNATVRQLTRKKEVVGEPHELAFWVLGFSVLGIFPSVL